MKHPIDPKIDCVFKALLGTEKNINLLIHFLNAILGKELKQAIVSVELLNPYNDKEFISDKLSIVDVKARNSAGQVFQIEIQLSSYPSLPSRIAYNWADIYSQQLEQGKNYHSLRATYSIWLLAENLIKEDNQYLHTFKLRDELGCVLNEHGGIWLLELNKFHSDVIEFDEQRWLQFFKEGEQLDDDSLPQWMETNEMRQVMNTLKTFSEKDREYDKYRARRDYLCQQRSIEFHFQEAVEQAQQAQQATQQAIEEKQQVNQQNEALLAEIKQLKALLNK